MKVDGDDAPLRWVDGLIATAGLRRRRQVSPRHKIWVNLTQHLKIAPTKAVVSSLGHLLA